MSRKKPLISIVTPCLNRAEFIREAIESVINQDYPYFEHIIIDGGSTDGTLDILKEYPHLKVISEPDNGVYDAINKGIRLAKGEIIGHLNSDDFYESNVFGAVVDKFSEDAKIDIVSGGATVFEDLKDGTRHTILEYNKSPHTDLTLANIMFGSPIINARFFHRRVYDKVGLYDTRYSITSDRDFLIRMVLNNIKTMEINKSMYYYRQHPGSLTYNPYNSNKFHILTEFLEIAENYMKTHNTPSTAVNTLRSWHSKEATRCVLYALKSMKILQSAKYSLQGWRFDKWWPVIFITYSMSISLDLLFNLSSRKSVTMKWG
jgi:glycosyltransferase involved in cell wall biosynthesis